MVRITARGVAVLTAWIALAGASPVVAQDARRELVQRIYQLTAPLVGEDLHFGYRLLASKSTQPGGGDAAELSFEVTGEETWAASLRSPWVNAGLVRTAARTALALPDHGVVFVGEGPVGDDSLAPEGFAARVLGGRASLVGLARAFALQTARSVAFDEVANAWKLDSDTGLSLSETSGAIIATSSGRKGFAENIRRVELAVHEPSDFEVATEGLRVEKIDRAELERMVFRAVRRVLTIGWPEALGVVPPRPRTVPHGELREVDGQLLVLLDGTPEQIGTAHGQLLGDLMRHTIDSTLYLVGTVETVRTGQWFPGVLEDAWARLSPHVPARHRRELAAMAEAVPGISQRELELGNVFPEYFHCSGFAVFGKATVDGVLYHGRVLDYMTLIGLQQAAVTQVVRPEGRHAFLSAGYAGFQGVVTGMNNQQISLGEMGGRGRFLWDGVPMATLMRRGLEECSTLAEVKQLWVENPRTCEYYYVFADGKGPSAVAVKAVPEGVSFMEPGEAHELLGPGIEDAVVISAGSRLQTLRQRVQEKHGAIDAEVARHLMDRPVAMSSNLHNALFAPALGMAWVAHASGGHPAAERPYVRYDLRALLAAAMPEAVPGVREARDSLDPKPDPKEDAQASLQLFLWTPEQFDVRTREEPGEWDSLVLFPSPVPSGDPRNDDVVLEWYAARERGVVLNGGGDSAPAVLVMHILDGRFRVARTVARFLSRRGVHAFVMHQPYYGRRGTRQQRRQMDLVVPRFRQAVADARRARDAIAVLPGIDAEHIAIQGTSLGGFVTTLAASLDGGFDQVFIALAGADLYSMLMKGGQDSAKIRRQLQQGGYDDERIEQLVKAIDPIRVAHRLDPERTWLYTAMFDQVVPAANGAALGRAAGLDREHHRWLPGGHYSSAVFIPEILAQILQRMRPPAGPMPLAK